MPGVGTALAAAAPEDLSLPCHRVPAEEGEGRDAAFPVPPAWLDLRGLRLPGNSKAAAGPGSARGLLGAGPELFGTARQGKRLRGGQAGALGAVGGLGLREDPGGRAQRRAGGRGAGLRRGEVGGPPTPPLGLGPFVSLPGPYGAWLAGAGAPAALPLSLMRLCRPPAGDRGRPAGPPSSGSPAARPAARPLPLEHSGWLLLQNFALLPQAGSSLSRLGCQRLGSGLRQAEDGGAAPPRAADGCPPRPASRFPQRQVDGVGPQAVLRSDLL